MAWCPLPSPSTGPAHLAHVLLTAGPADQQAWSTSIGRVLPADVTGMRIDAEIVVAAPPGVVWDLLADITNTGNWSPECIRTAWLDGHHDARPGVRFSGRNRALGGFEWTVTCVITQADRPRTLERVVLDDEDAAQTVDHPSSRRPPLDDAPASGAVRGDHRISSADAAGEHAAYARRDEGCRTRSALLAMGRAA